MANREEKIVFNEVYSVYTKTISEIIDAALSGKTTLSDRNRIIREYGFAGTREIIDQIMSSDKFFLLKEDGTTVLKNSPSFPLTNLERSWLKAVSLDPRVKLFDIDFSLPEDTEPLFTPEDYCLYDIYSDGDDFENETYIKNFRTVLQAVKEKQKVRIVHESPVKGPVKVTVVPGKIEYSEKDNKFRVLTDYEDRHGYINMGRILSCESAGADEKYSFSGKRVYRDLIIDINDGEDRGTLKRALFHFSHFKKECEKTGNNQYRLKISYDSEDENELVIRVLSFGPTIYVAEPERFRNLIKERLVLQKNCGL